MKILTLKLVSVITAAGMALGLASCRITKDITVETDINIDVRTGDEETETTARPEVTTAETVQTEIEVIAEPAETYYAENQNMMPSPDWVKALPQAQDENNKQLFIVAAMSMDRTTATISMHERDAAGNWVQILSTPGFVGKNGLCLDEDHKEGCGQTPAGVYHFNAAFGIAADPGCAMPYTQVNDDIYWSGDMRDGMRYNEMVNINDYPDLDMENSEHIVDYDYQYQYCLNISFNEDGTPGRGSAIFLHCIGPVKPYTGGCVAVPEYTMVQIMQNVDPDCVVIIDTVDNLNLVF